MTFAQSDEARCQVENEDVVGAAPTGDATIASAGSAISLPTRDAPYIRGLRVMTARSGKLSDM